MFKQAVAVVSLLAFTAQAGELYIRTGAGTDELDTSDLTATTSLATLEGALAFESSVAYEAAIGKKINSNVFAEIVVGQHQFDGNYVADANDDVELEYLNVGLVIGYEFAAIQGVSPYVSLGAGYLFAELDELNDTTVYEDNAFYGSYAAGLTYALGENVNIYAQYQAMMAQELKDEATISTIDLEFELDLEASSQIMVGIQASF
ncbi:MAG: hypothetical protein CMF27_07455 [Kiritimatiellaceae bacterium]|nr:hypothetical protein [Kiritimatiellaceae bacterium]|tara:strand:+ start:3807 stop:4421 length:615 start_codon:yes stop_codon:yes gene_type:complete